MSDNISLMLSKKNWAVVGATQDKSKFGYKVMKKLVDHGYNVYPVNPGYEEIDGIKCYKSISDISGDIDVIDLIVNPRLGMGVIDEAAEKGIKYIWCQPGAANEALVKKAQDKGMVILPSSCVLVELN